LRAPFCQSRADPPPIAPSFLRVSSCVARGRLTSFSKFIAIVPFRIPQPVLDVPHPHARPRALSGLRQFLQVATARSTFPFPLIQKSSSPAATFENGRHTWSGQDRWGKAAVSQWVAAIGCRDVGSALTRPVGI